MCVFGCKKKECAIISQWASRCKITHFSHRFFNIQATIAFPYGTVWANVNKTVQDGWPTRVNYISTIKAHQEALWPLFLLYSGPSGHYNNNNSGQGQKHGDRNTRTRIKNNRKKRARSASSQSVGCVVSRECSVVFIDCLLLAYTTQSHTLSLSLPILGYLHKHPKVSILCWAAKGFPLVGAD